MYLMYIATVHCRINDHTISCREQTISSSKINLELDFSSAISLRFYSPTRRQSLNLTLSYRRYGQWLHEHGLLRALAHHKTILFQHNSSLRFFCFRTFTFIVSDSALVQSFTNYLQLTKKHTHISVYVRQLTLL